MKRAEHGTHTGYRQHQRAGHRGVEICDDCREAWRTYNREWQAANYNPAKRRAAYERAKARGYYDREGAPAPRTR